MITCGIASIPSREDCLKKTLDSIRNQVDIVFVALNGYEYTPPYLEFMDNVSYTFSDNSMGDAMKFQMAQHCGGYFITLDDDLSVNEGYVEEMIEGINRYGVVSYHGKFYTPPVTSYRKIERNYRCLDEVKEDSPINLIGSGCMGFKTSEFKVDIERFEKRNMSDVWVSLLAHEQGLKPMVLKHRKGHINYLYPKGQTIWQDTQDYTEHIKIMNTFIK